VVVVDGILDRIVKFDSSGTPLVSWPTLGASDFLHWIAVDACNDVFVTDGASGRVEKFTSDGTFVTTWSVPGSPFSDPEGIAVQPDGRILVLDSEDASIDRYGCACAS
jgi:hypothetical protein